MIETTWFFDPSISITRLAAATETLQREAQATSRSLQGTALLTVNPDTLHRATDRMAAGARELCLSLEAVRTRRAAGAPR